MKIKLNRESIAKISELSQKKGATFQIEFPLYFDNIKLGNLKIDFFDKLGVNWEKDKDITLLSRMNKNEKLIWSLLLNFLDSLVYVREQIELELKLTEKYRKKLETFYDISSTWGFVA